MGKGFDPIKAFKENIKLIILLVILSIIFFDYIGIIILGIIFGYVGSKSLIITKMVPYISIETISASAIVLGYMYDWKIGLAFAVIAGTYGYVKLSYLNIISIVNTLLMALCGVLAALFASMGFGFTTTFLLAFTIRAFIGFPTFQIVNPNLPKNAMHAFGDGLFNMAITMHLMNIIYHIVSALGL